MDLLLIPCSGLLEHYYITKHYLHFDNGVAVTARYSNHLDSTILFSALHRVIAKHGALGVRFVGDLARHPSFQRLQSVDLTKVVQFMDKGAESLTQVIEEQFKRYFDTNADLPLWRLTVLNDNTVIFSWHHGIGDGKSGLAFHRALLSALNADNADYYGLNSVTIQPAVSIAPAIETAVNIRPSLSQFFHMVIELLAPVSWTRRGTAWTGNPVKLSTSRTHCRLLEFSAEDSTKFISLCRTHNATLTPTLHALAVCVLSRLLLADPRTIQSKLKSISTFIPISLRPISQTSPDIMCNHISAYHSYSSLSPSFSWTDASKLTSTLRSFRSHAAGIVGMLKFIFGQYELFYRDKVGKKRDGGLEISNIGKFDIAEVTDSNSADTWTVDRVTFAQFNRVIGAAIELNVVGTPSGGLTVTVVWSSETVEDALVEVFIPKFREAFYEILGETL